jgi:hypothetical protein
MGSCQTNSKKFTKSHSHSNNNDSLNMIDGLFSDMPEWEGERFRGQGIKRMKGYKCDLPIDELNKIREEFWNYNIGKDIFWKNIKQAVIMDDVRASNYLENIKLKTVNGCINELKDKKGKIFRIPNFCINDPFFEKIISDDVYDLECRKGKLIRIKLFDFYNNSNRNYDVEVDDNITGRELKLIFCRKENIDEKVIENIRLFFGGAEILDHHALFKHNVKNDYTVLVMLKQDANNMVVQ